MLCNVIIRALLISGTEHSIAKAVTVSLSASGMVIASGRALENYSALVITCIVILIFIWCMVYGVWCRVYRRRRR